MDTDWQTRVRWCEVAGITRKDIASSCGMSYSALGDLMSGATKEPRGMSAVRLHALSERHRPADQQHQAAA